MAATTAGNGLPPPATFARSGRRLYSPPGSGPAKGVPHARGQRQAAAQARAGKASQAARRTRSRRAAAAAATPRAAAAAAAVPASPPAPVTAAAAQPAGGGTAGAYRRSVAGPVRQAWQARTVPQEGAGAILALFAYPLLVAMLTGGPAKARGWLAAKFVNRPYAGPGSKLAPAPRGRPGPQPRPAGTHPGIRP